jgi:hypothetical protein
LIIFLFGKISTTNDVNGQVFLSIMLTVRMDRDNIEQTFINMKT